MSKFKQKDEQYEESYRYKENNDSTLNQKFLAAYLFGAPGQLSTETKRTYVHNPQHSDDPKP